VFWSTRASPAERRQRRDEQRDRNCEAHGRARELRHADSAVMQNNVRQPAGDDARDGKSDDGESAH
jgi:hypothetical protein